MSRIKRTFSSSTKGLLLRAVEENTLLSTLEGNDRLEMLAVSTKQRGVVFQYQQSAYLFNPDNKGEQEIIYLGESRELELRPLPFLLKLRKQELLSEPGYRLVRGELNQDQYMMELLRLTETPARHYAQLILEISLFKAYSVLQEQEQHLELLQTMKQLALDILRAELKNVEQRAS